MRSQSTPSDDGHRAGRSRAEATFERWLTNCGGADIREALVADELQFPLTRMLGQLVLSGRELSPDAAAGVGMPPGTTQGHAATELLLAVMDTAGPRCPSYRSAASHLREHDDTFAAL